MTPETLGYANLAGLMAVLGFLWTLHRDMANVRERLARLEGMFSEMSRSIQSLREDVRYLYDRERPASGE